MDGTRVEIRGTRAMKGMHTDRPSRAALRRSPPPRRVAQEAIARVSLLAHGAVVRLGVLRRLIADRREVRLVAGSALFDAAWYLERYPDVAARRADAVTHYVRHGAREGRDPGPGFDTRRYLSRHPDVAASGVNPLVHHLQRDGRAPAGRLDASPSRSTAPEAGSAAAVGGSDLDATVRELQRLLGDVTRRLDAETRRVDHLLGAHEGTLELVDDYRAYRETPAYAEAYAVDEPLVSVCIATLDRADLLIERAIASVQAQSYRNLEIVVVGDHCSDDTEPRVRALAEPRITFVNLTERGPYPPPGLDRWRVAGTNAMNHALSLATGHFVTHLDDDDAMVPHRIETLVAAARRERADVVWHAFLAELPDGTWARRGSPELQLRQVTTGSVLYHRYFARIPWDVGAYLLGEPGDWNRLRKLKLLRPRAYYVDEPLLYHHAERSQSPFVVREGERFLE